jgi:hypothetical protein
MTDAFEDRVRNTLAAHAQSFLISPDAWDRTRIRAARTTAGGWRRRSWRLLRQKQLLLPALAAAVVVAIIVAATATAHGFAGTAGPKPGSASRSTASRSTASRSSASRDSTTSATGQCGSPGTAPTGTLGPIVPTSPVLCLKVTEGAQRGYLYFQVGRDNPLSWLPWVPTGLQYCYDLSDTTPGSGSFIGENCWQLPQLGNGQLASVTIADEWPPLARLSLPMPLLGGFAEQQVASVSAVLPDGRTYRGTVGGSRGFPEKAWAVLYPGVKGTRLIFRDAAGRQVASLTAPPGQVVPTYATWRPHSGGTVYHCPDCDMTTVAYPVGGHVGFWVPGCGPDLLISPARPPSAGSLPAVGGTTLLCDAGGGSWGIAIGYARQDVTRVELRLPDGWQISVPTYPAGWPGSNLRLWGLIEPQNTWNSHFTGSRSSAVTAQAYDGAHPIGQTVDVGYPDA